MKTKEKTTTYCYVRVTFTETIEMEYDCPHGVKKMINGEEIYQDTLRKSATHLALGIIKRTDINDSEWQKGLNIKAEIL
jgi:hypothetical protein